jgi:hypothetical protein
VHKVYLYIKGDLVDDNPFYIYVNGDVYTTSSAYGLFTALPFLKTSINNIGAINSSSSLEFAAAAALVNPAATTTNAAAVATVVSTPQAAASSSATAVAAASVPIPAEGAAAAAAAAAAIAATRSMTSTSDSQVLSQNNICLAALGHGTILCARKDHQFHFVINDKNIQGLCVYGKQLGLYFGLFLLFLHLNAVSILLLDPLNDPLPFKLGQDDHENGAVILSPKLEGAHKIVGLVEGRDFEAQLFVLRKPCFESLFEMNSYSEENIIEKPFVIMLKEPNLEVDAYGNFT